MSARKWFSRGRALASRVGRKDSATSRPPSAKTAWRRGQLFQPAARLATDAATQPAMHEHASAWVRHSTDDSVVSGAREKVAAGRDGFALTLSFRPCAGTGDRHRCATACLRPRQRRS